MPDTSRDNRCVAWGINAGIPNEIPFLKINNAIVRQWLI